VERRCCVGYPELKPHDRRHGVAIEGLEQRQDLEQVRALLATEPQQGQAPQTRSLKVLETSVRRWFKSGARNHRYQTGSLSRSI